MCGSFFVPEDDSIEMIRAIVEYLEHRNVKAKTGDVFPGDVAAVVASNRHLEPQPFAMEWGYHLSDGKRIINARSGTAAQKAMFADGIRQRRCLIPAQHYYEWEKADGRKCTEQTDDDSWPPCTVLTQRIQMDFSSQGSIASKRGNRCSQS